MNARKAKESRPKMDIDLGLGKIVHDRRRNRRV
jgi:hypothetical protein